ncbi:MAG TPA: RIP metalloprotease RseP [Bryobacteraceae bacterium]|nr:RIP metalloprotease RseP [Bryobacteraceae bacterium]
MAILTSIFWYLILIGVMILVHEAGHYFAARFFDVKVETFSFGFGPRLFGFKRGDTDFRFSALLFGGYVKMAGDQPGDEAGNDPRNLLAKPRWQRLIITFAGPAINVVLAVVLMTGLNMFHFPVVPTPPDPVIGWVDPNGGVAKAGIREGDQVLRFDDVTDPTWRDIFLKEISSPKIPIGVLVRRGSEKLNFTVTPVLDPKNGIGRLAWDPETEVRVSTLESGMAAGRAGLQVGDVLVSANGIPLRSIARLSQIEKETDGMPLDICYSRAAQEKHVTVKPEKSNLDGQGERWMIGMTLERRIEFTKLPLHEAFVQSVAENNDGAKLIFRLLEQIVERKISPKSIAGPIEIAHQSGEAAKEGATAYLELMALVSLNLAIVNLLPIPIMDGGSILMLLIEMLMRRDMDLRMKEAVVKIGFVFLMVVVVFTIYNDISRILPG